MFKGRPIGLVNVKYLVPIRMAPPQPLWAGKLDIYGKYKHMTVTGAQQKKL